MNCHVVLCITLVLIVSLATPLSAAPTRAFPATRIDNGLNDETAWQSAPAIVLPPNGTEEPARLKLGWDEDRLYLRVENAPPRAVLILDFNDTDWALEANRAEPSFSRITGTASVGTATSANGTWTASAPWKEIGETSIAAGKNIFLRVRWSVNGGEEKTIPADFRNSNRFWAGVFFLNDTHPVSECAPTLTRPLSISVSTDARGGNPYIKIDPEPTVGLQLPCDLTFRAIGRTETIITRQTVMNEPVKIELPGVPNIPVVGVTIRLQDMNGPWAELEYRTLRPGIKLIDWKGAPDWEEPADFDAYWNRAKAELRAAPRNLKITELPEQATATGRLYRVEMTSLGGIRIAGWYFAPKDANVLSGRPAKRYPAIQIMPGYGAEQIPADRTAEGYITLALNPRGHGPSGQFWPLPPYHIRYHREDPESYYYRGAYMDCLAGIDFLMNRPEVDSKRVAVEGGSQGGALALAMAALDHRLAACCANVPFLSDFKTSVLTSVTGNQMYLRDEFYSEGETGAKARKTVSYVDARFHSRRIQCPTLIGVGEMDRMCAAPGGVSDYNNIPDSVTKRLLIMPGREHETPPEYRRAADDWYKKWLK